jgi:hypothetical protein
MARHARITNGDPTTPRRKVRRRRRVMNRSTAGGGTGNFTGQSSGSSVSKTRKDLAHLLIDFSDQYGITPKAAVGMLRDLW